MKSSLVSREVIADSVELTMRGHCYDALVGWRAATSRCRHDDGDAAPQCAVGVLYGGSIMPGRFHDRDVTVVDVFEPSASTPPAKCPKANCVCWRKSPVPARAPAAANSPQHHGLRGRGDRPAAALFQRPACGDPGARRFRADGRPHGDEAVGEESPSTRHRHPQKLRECRHGGAASGGSTNAALHLPPWRTKRGSSSTCFDVAEIFKKTPYIASMKPGGKYVAKDMWEAGGMPMLMRALLDAACCMATR